MDCLCCSLLLVINAPECISNVRFACEHQIRRFSLTQIFGALEGGLGAQLAQIYRGNLHFCIDA